MTESKGKHLYIVWGTGSRHDPPLMGLRPDPDPLKPAMITAVGPETAARQYIVERDMSMIQASCLPALSEWHVCVADFYGRNLCNFKIVVKMDSERVTPQDPYADCKPDTPNDEKEKAAPPEDHGGFQPNGQTT